MNHHLDFLIPLRIDSQDRLENCETALRFLSLHFPRSRIFLIEHDSEQKIGFHINYPRVTHHFIKSEGRFSKSSAINAGLLQSNAFWIGIYDADIIIHPHAITETLDTMACDHRYRVAIPHNLVFVNLRSPLKEEIRDSLDYARIPHFVLGQKSTDSAMEVFPYELPAGLVIFERKLLKYYGGYNRKMISYGYEDLEVLYRLRKLGHPWYVNRHYNLIHFDHHRGTDSQQNEFYQANENECNKVSRMTPLDLLSYTNRELSLQRGLRRLPQYIFQALRIHRIGLKNILPSR